MKGQMASLAEVSLVITKGTTPTTIGLSFEAQGIPFIRVQNLRDGRVDHAIDPLWISPDVHRTLSRSAILPFDVLVSIAGTIGRVALAQPGSPEMNCNQAVAIIRPGAAVAPKYLVHYLQSDAAQERLRAGGVTGTITNLSLGTLRNLQIPLPPLSEQRRIAAILDQADALRAKRRQALARLDNLSDSIFSAMFGDPVINPLGLATTRLEDVCRRVTDGTHQPPMWAPSGIPFLFVSNIIDGRIDFSTSKYISEETHLALTNRCPIEDGDILYTTVGSYGNAALVDTKRKFAFQRHIAHVKPATELIHPAFLVATLQSSGVRRQADRVARGVAQKTINLGDLKNFIVFSPPLATQHAFVSRVAAINHLKATQRASLAQLDALFASLQQRAFREGFGAVEEMPLKAKAASA